MGSPVRLSRLASAYRTDRGPFRAHLERITGCTVCPLFLIPKFDRIMISTAGRPRDEGVASPAVVA